MVRKSFTVGYTTKAADRFDRCAVRTTLQALFSRSEIPDGVFAYMSRHNVMPLSELEKLLIVTHAAEI